MREGGLSAGSGRSRNDKIRPDRPMTIVHPKILRRVRSRCLLQGWQGAQSRAESEERKITSARVKI